MVRGDSVRSHAVAPMHKRMRYVVANHSGGPAMPKARPPPTGFGIDPILRVEAFKFGELGKAHAREAAW